MSGDLSALKRPGFSRAAKITKRFCGFSRCRTGAARGSKSDGDFSPVASCVNENTGMTGLPTLHDGFFDGLWLSANKGVRLFVRTVAGERSTIVLTDVEALNFNGLRAGNIIFELVVIAPDRLTMQDITQVYDLKPDEAEMARKLLNKAQEQSLSVLAMSTSYGAEGQVLCSRS
jgi:hypothetical protein